MEGGAALGAKLGGRSDGHATMAHGGVAVRVYDRTHNRGGIIWYGG